MGIKTVLRNLVPLRLQVPVKYLFNTFSGGMEPELDILSLLIDAGQHVIDVGGNRGTYAYKLYKLGANVEVFEPNGVCSDILKAWAAGKPSVCVHPVALSSCVGNAVLHVPVDSAGTAHDASATLENKLFAKSEDKTVELRTLDSFGFQNITFIKIDVEGHECSVLGGASATIEAQKPSLLVEIEQRHLSRPIAEVFDLIMAYGYSAFFLRGGKLQDINQFDVLKDQDFEGSLDRPENYINNFIFVHPSTINPKFSKAINQTFGTIL